MREFGKSFLLVAALALSTVAQAELRDPTRPSYGLPAGNSTESPSALRVSAVFISGERRIAVINGQRLRVGETIAGATVTAIDKNNVSFVRSGRVFTVSLLSAPGRQ